MRQGPLRSLVIKGHETARRPFRPAGWSLAAVGCGITAALLAAAVIIAPWPLGSTGPVARLAVEAVMAIVALAWLVARPPERSSLWPAVAILAVGLVQLVPLPGSGAGVPRFSAAGDRLDDAGPSTASVEPALTVLTSYRGILAAACIAATASLARDSSRWRWLAGAVASSGAIVWLLGLSIPVRRDKERVILGFIDIAGPVDWWLTPLKEPRETAAFGYPAPMTAVGQQFSLIDWAIGDGFGPYVYSNHYAAAIYLTVPLLTAFWLWWSRGRLPATVRFGAAAAILAAAVWTVGSAADSRAGAGAVIIACLVVLWLALEHKLASRIAGLTAAGCAVLYAGFAVALYGRIQGVARLFPEALQARIAALLADPRSVATATAWRLFRESPVLGTGLGTYGNAATRRVGTHSPCYYAHNEYAQLLTETGLFGTAIACGFAVYLVMLFVRFCRESRPPERILGAGAWAGVAGIVAHSAFDWNLHVPANALLTCVVTGLAIAAVPRRPESNAVAALRAGRLDHVLRWAVCAAVVAGLPLLGRDCASEQVCRQLREAITAARLATKDPQRPSPWPALEQAHAAGERMAGWDPANAKLAQLVGQTSLLLGSKLQPIDEVDVWIRDAAAWFDRARSHSAVCTGLPEPIPLGPGP
jgi:hypothetical protein